MSDYATLARLGVATMHEAAGRIGIVDLDLVQVVPGSRVAGPARTAVCAPGDNSMVHAAVAHAVPGDVLVLTLSEPAPVALIGELLVTQAQSQGVVGVLVDGAVRDLDELARDRAPGLGAVGSSQGATKGVRRRARRPRRRRRRRDRPGDLVVMDCDGVVALPGGRVGEVLPLARERAEREVTMRERYAAGELSYDLNGLREVVEERERRGSRAGRGGRTHRRRPRLPPVVTCAVGSGAGPAGVANATSARDAVRGAEVVLSLNAAAVALDAACDCAGRARPRRALRRSEHRRAARQARDRGGAPGRCSPTSPW